MADAIDDNSPIFFRTVEEFAVRAGYQLQLTCTRDELDRIVGKYERPKTDQIECGLNGCTQRHMYGYIIQTKVGAETNCGQDCGSREFGVKFHEVEASFKKAEEDQLRRRLLGEIVKNRTDLLVAAKNLRSKIQDAANRVSTVVSEIKREPALYHVFESCLRIGGQIRIAQTVDEALRRDKADLITIGRLEGVNAIGAYQALPKDIYYGVLLPLGAMDAATLSNLKSNELEKRSRDISDFSNILARASQFLRDEERFSTKANLSEIAKLKELVPKRSRKDRLDRVLARLPSLARD